MRRGSKNKFISEGERMIKSIMKLVVLLSILAACSPATPLATVTPTLTPSRTPIPSKTSIPLDTPTLIPTIAPTFTTTPTSTPQPPLTEHEWNPELVLISIRSNFGDGGASIGDMGSPSLILYADGSMFVSGTKNIDGKDYGQVLTKKLDKKEICQNLNTLDQIGYLDYDRSDYSFIGGRPLAIGYPDTFITVNAWKSTFNGYSGLNYFLRNNLIDEFYGQTGYPVISPALRNAYNFLTHYPQDGFEVYKPSRLAIWIIPAEYVFPDSFESLAKIWQLKSPSFKNLLKRIDIDPQSGTAYTTILNGNEARLVYNFLGEVKAVQVFVIDEPDGSKKYYALLARPLLPYEVLGDYGDMSEIPVPDSPKPNFKLTCRPSDGVLPIPTLTNP
jgi:hypothetical protein